MSVTFISKMLTIFTKKYLCCIIGKSDVVEESQAAVESFAAAKNVEEPQAEVEEATADVEAASDVEEESDNVKQGFAEVESAAENVEEAESPAEGEAAAVAAKETAEEAADKAEAVVYEDVSGVAEGTYKYILI